MPADRRMGDKRVLDRKEGQRTHIMVATPAYDGKVECNYSQSLAEAAFTAPLYQMYFTAAVMGNGAFIDLARNIFVKQFIDKHKEATHLFFIDADLKFEARAIVGLAKSGLPICAGMYRRRQEPEDYPVKMWPYPEGGGLWIEDDWLLCERVPTGCLCIRRDVLEEMAQDAPKIYVHEHGLVPWIFHTAFDGNGLEDLAKKYNLSPEFVADYGKWLPTDGAKFIGEDYGFCDDYVKKYKKPIPVWTDFDFVHGGYKCNFARWLSDKVAEEDKAKKLAA